MKAYKIIAIFFVTAVIAIAASLVQCPVQKKVEAQVIEVNPTGWERIDKFTSRMWVPEGWIVRSLSSYETGNHFIIVADCKHVWKIKYGGGDE
jgi:hypothetical protein